MKKKPKEGEFEEFDVEEPTEEFEEFDVMKTEAEAEDKNRDLCTYLLL